MATKREIMLELEKLGSKYSTYAKKSELEEVLAKARAEHEKANSTNSVKMLQSLLNKGRYYQEGKPLKENGIKNSETMYAFNNAVYKLGLKKYPTFNEMIIILSKKLS